MAIAPIMDEVSRFAAGTSPGGPSSYELAILTGLQRKPVYQGTVDPQTVNERRTANRRARRSRRVNRLRLR